MVNDFYQISGVNINVNSVNPQIDTLNFYGWIWPKLSLREEFDYYFYIKQYGSLIPQEIRRSQDKVFEWFVNEGIYQGHSIDKKFDYDVYLRNNPDVACATQGGEKYLKNHPKYKVFKDYIDKCTFGMSSPSVHYYLYGRVEEIEGNKSSWLNNGQDIMKNEGSTRWQQFAQFSDRSIHSPPKHYKKIMDKINDIYLKLSNDIHNKFNDLVLKVTAIVTLDGISREKGDYEIKILLHKIINELKSEQTNDYGLKVELKSNVEFFEKLCDQDLLGNDIF